MFQNPHHYLNVKECYDLGNSPDKPHKNIARLLKGKPFRKPDISATIQEVLGKFRVEGRDGFVVDVGGNVAAASDRLGNITFHKLVGRLDNGAVSATSAKLAFKSNEEIALQVKSVPLDEVIPESEPVLLLKIDVQDERLLQASNSSSKEIRDFLRNVGYQHCTQHGTDAHCTK
ncbi:S-adenosyl-L-methionine-dependent methyltransferase [Trema orientale]|uniref:S-adenosyl-L-methionine-dependent methyltransferase n=1 Tax=Trema orientale TaxID=63057 RepID=A0A2P5C475_TREOI|nr:S-adenosyl-L-methionine-dependent methyltransferase [Trema orientale]